MINILYEDDCVLVVHKPAGMESQGGKTFAMDMVSAIKNELAFRERKADPYVGVVHRLDRPVSGVMVYAKTPKAAKDLSLQIQKRQIQKRYYALLRGTMREPGATLTDYLLLDKKNNISRVTDASCKGAKQAVLRYQTVAMDTFSGFKQLLSISKAGSSELSLVDIELITGRHHQIRVQMAHAGCPIWGDTKYDPDLAGSKGFGQIGLCAYQLKFFHPLTKKQMCFSI